MTVAVANPYLQGNFAPVRQEIFQENLPITGKLPPDLSGIFIRNGPNPQFLPIGKYHWIDGDGMLHAVELHADQASYRNRYIQTQGFEIERVAGKAIWTGVLEPPQISNIHSPHKNTANTAIVWHAGQLLALWEGSSPYIIKIPSLETIGSKKYCSWLNCAFTAHPKIDPVTREMMFFGYSPLIRPYLQYGIIDASGKLLRLVPIELPTGVIMHDFAITERYSIFIDLPLTFRSQRMLQGKPMLMFEPNRPSRFGIIPRYGNNNQIRWFYASPCYITHTLNAYEEGDEVILLGCRASSAGLGLSIMPKDLEAELPYLYRWRFNLRNGKMYEEKLNSVSVDFPRINEGFLGRKTRYGYALRRANSTMILFDALIKYDFDTLSWKIWEFEPGCYGGDVVFVPRTDATEEDDGWLLSFIHDENNNTSQLIVVDARDITSGPVARVWLPQRVPYGFHATWIDRKEYSNSI